MANANRRAGVLYFRVDGRQYDARGSFSYNLGSPKREAIVGPSGVYGYKETPQAPYIEGEVVDARDLDVAALQSMTESTVTLELASGKTIVLRDAWYAADGQVGTEEANVQVRFEGMGAEELQSGS